MQLHQFNKVKRKATPTSKHSKSTSQERYKIQRYHTLNNQQQSKSTKYEILEQIAQGSYSTIYIVENKLHGGYYAMKKVLQDPRQINRELDIHLNMHHPHIVPLRDYFFSYENQNKYLHLIMDLYQGNLKNALKVPIRRVARQLFQAGKYLEDQQIMHRDLKPANILYQNGNVFISDFGSAKKIDGTKSLNYVCSRAYRAPELLFGKTFYNSKIDVWALGCILAELELGKQLFYGENTVDQLVEICKLLGTPNEIERSELGCSFHIPAISPRKLILQKDLVVVKHLSILIYQFEYIYLFVVLLMKINKSVFYFSTKKNNSSKNIVYFAIGSLFIATSYYLYYNVKYMDDIAAARITDFEQRSGMKISEFKTENPIKEEIRPEYIEKQKRIYRQKMEQSRKILENQK